MNIAGSEIHIDIGFLELLEGDTRPAQHGAGCLQGPA